MKSLELNWLRKKVDKSIPIPEVVYHPLENAGGQYYSPNSDDELYDPDGKPYSMRYGVIVINPEYGPYQSTIAHEWRHHWQHYNGFEFEISPTRLFDEFDYDTALLKYFTESNTEWDAVRFQYKYSTIYPAVLLNHIDSEIYLFSLLNKTIDLEDKYTVRDWFKLIVKYPSFQKFSVLNGNQSLLFHCWSVVHLPKLF